jgi:hypothetical protein
MTKAKQAVIQAQLINVDAAVTVAMREAGQFGKRYETRYHTLCARLGDQVRTGGVADLRAAAREMINTVEG